MCITTVKYTHSYLLLARVKLLGIRYLVKQLNQQASKHI